MKISAGESLNAVSETALLTLKAKGLEAEKGDPVITTEVGKQSLANLQARLPLETRTRLLNRRLPTSLARYLALRARKDVAYARGFIAENPDGLAVSLGCGFDPNAPSILVPL